MTEQFKPNLSAEDRLDELDPELTDRLARALDRFQLAQPYQQLTGRRTDPAKEQLAKAPLPELTAEQKAARESMINQELSALIMLAGELNQEFNAARIKATPDRHYRDSLKAELQKAALDKKKTSEPPQ